jgi:hypothetical protein
MEAKNLLKSSAKKTSAHAALAAAFKRCCSNSGSYDGTLRDHYL